MKVFFADHTEPFGRLPQVESAQALWHFIVLASKQYYNVRDEVEYEDEPLKNKLDKRFHTALKAVCEIYALTPAEIFTTGNIAAAKAEVIRSGGLGAKWPDDLERWIQNGGKVNYLAEVGDSWLKN